MKIQSLFLICLIISTSLIAQTDKNISLEELWGKYTYVPNTVPGFNFMKDGRHYSRLERKGIVKYDLTTGMETETIFNAAEFRGTEGFPGFIDDYHFSEDEGKILIATETEPIYRHSTKANFYIFNRKSKKLTPLFLKGKQRLASFNPAADKVAFVFENNLFLKDLTQEDSYVQVTTDGELNKIINGGTDWVYEEEFSFDKGFEWSPDGKRIAFMRFDERDVTEFTMTNYYNELYPEYITFKYPKVGEKNAIVTVHLFDLETETIIEAAVTKAEDYYIPRIRWTADPEKLCVFQLNRHQNHLKLLLANAKSGKTTLLLEEKNKYYIDEMVFDNVTFLENGKQFIYTSEKDGWHHIYLYDMNGKEVQQITNGEWDVTEFYGIDEKRSLVYFQAATRSPMQREVISASLKGKRQQKMAEEEGWNSADFSSTFDYFVLTHSTANSPATYAVYDHTGKEVRVIEDNSNLREIQKEYSTQPVEFFSFTTSEKVMLNGWLIKPADMQQNKKYPVLMYLYGGPNSQEVVDQWMGQNYWWFQMLAEQGFVVACVDNRGTAARGEEFRKMTYQQLGHYETIDQIEAAKYIGSLQYTDPARIGIFGWSYGGYMSTLCLLKGNDVFKSAIAVAPVTNWRWYDTIYTERFMRTEKENPDGYRENSPIYFADRLKGDYLIIHGMGDDNVHFQHTTEMANALIGANKQFETYFYPNRNHGIYGGTTRLHLYTKMTGFLKDKLLVKEKTPAKKKPIRKVAPFQKKPKTADQ